MNASNVAGAQLAIDVTQMYHNPARTGVQRVVRELLRRWPTDAAPPEIVRFEDGQGLLRFPPAAVALITETDPDAPGLSHAELRARLHSFALQPLADADRMPVLIPEVFYDPVRCHFHEQRLAAAPGSLAMLLYDFLPLLHSDLFSFANTLTFMPAARLARRAPHVAFISAQTRHEYATRILHRARCSPRDLERIGPVLPPGADGLGVERQHWSPERRVFASLGSIDGRKNQHHIVAAFTRLWDAGHDTRLTLIGHSYGSSVPEWLETACRSPHFRWLQRATDADVAAVLRDANVQDARSSHPRPA